MTSFLYHPGTSWQWATLQGPDAKDFLQRLSTVDLNLLSAGQGARGCFLNPHGKIQSTFWLWCLDAQTFAFEYDAGFECRWREALASLIDHYTFAEKIRFTLHPALQSVWLLSKVPLMTPETVRSNDGIPFVCQHSKKEFGQNWITAWGSVPEIKLWEEKQSAKLTQLGDRVIPINTLELHAMRISQMTPWTDFEIQSSYNPLELGMKEWIAPHKGCYPGQEVIEKIISLGSPSQRLVLIELPGTVAPEIGSEILLDHEGTRRASGAKIEAIGKVTSSRISDSGHALALGIVRRVHALPELQVFIKSEDQPMPAQIKKISTYV